MNHIRWAAWGVINIDDTSAFDRMQRRNYIKRARAELKERGCTLNCGGSTQAPWYQMVQDITGNKKSYAGKDAFKKACAWLLELLGETPTGDHAGEQNADERAQTVV